MRVLLLLILLLQGGWAAVLLSQNLYDRPNRVDLMLSFDAPFEGKVRKKEEADGTITLYLEGVSVKKPFFKSLPDSFVQSVAVTGAGEKSVIVKVVPSRGPIRLQASKTVDGFGLRLRVQPVASSSVPTNAIPNDKNALQKSLKSSNLPGWRYWSVMAVLVLLLILLWWAKKRAGAKLSRNGWLMPGNLTDDSLPQEATVRFQKPLDPQNRLLLIEYAQRQYLVIVGQGNLLLDTFGAEGRIENEDEFTRLFEQNRQRLDRFIQEELPDAYETFKANASKEEPPAR